MKGGIFMKSRQSSASVKRTSALQLALFIGLVILCDCALQAQAADFRELASQVGKKIAQEVRQHPLDENMTIFEYTDAQFGRYWHPGLKRTIGTIDLFFWAQFRGDGNFWGVPMGGLKVEAVHVLRFIPVS